MSRMLRLVLGVALLVLMLPSLATAEPTPPASSLISKDAVLVLEVAQPKAVLDFVLGNKVLDLITATPVYKQQIARRSRGEPSATSSTGLATWRDAWVPTGRPVCTSCSMAA